MNMLCDFLNFSIFFRRKQCSCCLLGRKGVEAGAFTGKARPPAGRGCIQPEGGGKRHLPCRIPPGGHGASRRCHLPGSEPRPGHAR